MAIAGSPWWPANRMSFFVRRVLSLDPTQVNTGWEDVLIAEGVAHYAAASGNTEAADWAAAWTEHHLGVPMAEGPPIRSTTFGGTPVRGIRLGDYCGNWGAPLVLAPLARGTQSARLLESTRAVADFILRSSLRGADGVILHSGHQRTVWVDTLYYTSAPLAAAHAATGESRYAEKALRHERNLRHQQNKAARAERNRTEAKGFGAGTKQGGSKGKKH